MIRRILGSKRRANSNEDLEAQSAGGTGWRPEAAPALEFAHPFQSVSFLLPFSLHQTTTFALSAFIQPGHSSAAGRFLPVLFSRRAADNFDREVDVATFLQALAGKDLLTPEGIVHALALLLRLQEQHRFPLNTSNIALVFCVACSLSVKMLRDQSLQQSRKRTIAFAEAAGFAPEETPQWSRCELSLFSLLDWDVYVAPSVFIATLFQLSRVLQHRLVLRTEVIESVFDSCFTTALPAALGPAASTPSTASTTSTSTALQSSASMYSLSHHGFSSASASASSSTPLMFS